jgi:hypothetical protein
MKERSFDEMIAYFNRRVSEMDIAQDYKMELLGMVTALGYKHEKTAQRWIPCSERLSEDLEEVNVTWVNHDPEPYYDFAKDKPFTASAVYYKGKWYWYSSTCRDLLAEYGRNPNQEIDDGIEIIAWMPLPEPYREEGD